MKNLKVCRLNVLRLNEETIFHLYDKILVKDKNDNVIIGDIQLITEDSLILETRYQKFRNVLISDIKKIKKV